MESLAQNEPALKALDLSVTTSQPPSPHLNVTAAWFKLTPTERALAVAQKDECAGVTYVTTSKGLQAFTIVSRASEPTDRATWLIGQEGNHLHQGQSAMRLPLSGVCGSVVVPMRETHATALGLTFDETLIVDNENTTLWDNCEDLTVTFPGEGELRMVVFPCTIALGYGATVPGSFALLVESIDSTNPNISITAGQPMLGVAMALRALTQNDFCTFLGIDNKCGTPVDKFTKKFKATPSLRPSMLIEEGFCPRNSNISLQHIWNYDRLLMAALMH